MDYRERLYEKYTSSHASHLKSLSRNKYKWMARDYQKRFGSFLPKDKRAKILELGCGQGEFIHFLMREGYDNSFGVDISKEQIEIAKQAGIQNVAVGDAMEFLRQHSDEYSIISAHDIIEHFSKNKILEFLDMVHNSLEIGGRVFVSTLNAQSLFSARIRYGDFTHEVGFTPTSLAQVLRISGFTEIQIHPKEPVILDFRSGVRFILWKVLKQILKFSLIVDAGKGRAGGDLYLDVLTETMFAVARKSLNNNYT